MSVKKFEEYCENCGCPLDICCKSKQPVVSLQALRVFVEDFKFKNPEMEGANLALKHLLSWAEN